MLSYRECDMASQSRRRLAWLVIISVLVALFLFARANSVGNIQASDSLSGPSSLPNSDLPVVCRTDAISYWKLDETSGAVFVDSVGTNNGSCPGSDCPVPASGQVNGAQTFNGSSTRITVPHNSSLNVSDSLTLSAWVNTATCSGRRVIVGKYTGTSSWWLGCDESGAAMFSLRDSNGTNREISSGGLKIDNGQWHHLVGVRDGASGQNLIYVNGSQIAAVSQAYSGNFNNNSPVAIGFHANAYFFNGTIDEVAIYGRALTAVEIARHYQAGLINLGYDVDNWTVTNGAWTSGTSWYSGSAPDSSGYAVIRNHTDLTAATTIACADVMPDATLNFGGHELTANGAFNNYGTVQQVKAANTVNGMVEFLHVTGDAGTLYRGVEITPTANALNNFAVTIRAASLVDGDYCANDLDAPLHADRCFALTPEIAGPAIIRLYAANPDDLKGIPISTLRPYRFSNGWQALTGNLTNGTNGNFAYAQAETSGFSSFLLGGLYPLGTVYGVDLSPPTATRTGLPGAVLAYTLTITNSGTVNDTFSISLSGNQWTTDAPTSVTLDAAESTEFVVSVTIPATVVNGENDTVNVTATSIANELATAASRLTSTAAFQANEPHKLYLPAVLRP
jgi:hypothetical protein